LTWPYDQITLHSIYTISIHNEEKKLTNKNLFQN